jgi:hypothetical protein
MGHPEPVSSRAAAIVVVLAGALAAAGLVIVNSAAGSEVHPGPVYMLWDGTHRWCPSGVHLPGILAADGCYPDSVLGFYRWVYAGAALFVIGFGLVLSRIRALLSTDGLSLALIKALALAALAALLLMDADQISQALCCSLEWRSAPILDPYDAFPAATAILNLAAVICLASTFSILHRMAVERRLRPNIGARWWLAAALAGVVFTGGGVALLYDASACYLRSVFPSDTGLCRWASPAAAYGEAYVSLGLFVIGLLVLTMVASLAIPTSRRLWLIPKAAAFLLLAAASGVAWILLMFRQFCIGCNPFPPDTSPAFDIASRVIAFGFWACLAAALATVVSRWGPFRPRAASAPSLRTAPSANRVRIAK